MRHLACSFLLCLPKLRFQPSQASPTVTSSRVSQYGLHYNHQHPFTCRLYLDRQGGTILDGYTLAERKRVSNHFFTSHQLLGGANKETKALVALKHR